MERISMRCSDVFTGINTFDYVLKGRYRTMFGRRFGHHFHGGDWEAFPWQQRGPGRGPWGGPGFGRGPWGEGQGPWQRPEFWAEAQALRSTAGEVARLFGIADRNAMGNPEKLSQLRAFLESSRKELLDIIGQSGPASQGETPQSEQV